MEEKNENISIGVYIKINENNDVVEIDSDIFISDLTDWIKIDEGFGDKYAHAQSQYLAKPLIDENRKYNYKFIDGKVTNA